jgi:hypothetical protein
MPHSSHALSNLANFTFFRLQSLILILLHLYGRIIVFCVFLACINFCRADDLWVDANANGSINCTQADPCRTIQSALRRALVGALSLFRYFLPSLTDRVPHLL